MKDFIVSLFPKGRKNRQDNANKVIESNVNQDKYIIAIHPDNINIFDAKVLKEVNNMISLYSNDIVIIVNEAIDTYAKELGDEPFKNVAGAGTILLDLTDKDDTKYVLFRFDLHYANSERYKYIVELKRLEYVSVDDYLDYYNEGIRNGMIKKESKN